jgi:hypothetical protein
LKIKKKNHFMNFIFLNSAKAGAGGMDGSLHLSVPSMNRLNQTKSATFSILGVL